MVSDQGWDAFYRLVHSPFLSDEQRLRQVVQQLIGEHAYIALVVGTEGNMIGLHSMQ